MGLPWPYYLKLQPTIPLNLDIFNLNYPALLSYETFNMGLLTHYIWRRQWRPTPVLLPGKSHGWRSLVGCSPWDHWESDTTERLHFPFSLSCIGEGNGNPLQCSCLKNPRDGGAWWAAVYGVAQSRTRLKRLSSKSNTLYILLMYHFKCLWSVSQQKKKKVSSYQKYFNLFCILDISRQYSLVRHFNIYEYYWMTKLIYVEYFYGF